MNYTLLSIIYFIALSHALMLTVALWRKSAPEQPGRVLAALLFLFAYPLFEGGSLYSGFYQFWPHAMSLIPGIALLIGPIFYAYVTKVSGRKRFTVKSWALHLMPWASYWLFNAPFIFRSAEAKIGGWDRVLASDDNRLLPYFFVAILLSMKVHLATYLTMSWRELKLFEASVNSLRSDDSQTTLNHLKTLAIALFILEAIWVVLFIGQQFFSIGTLSFVSDAWLLFMALIVLTMGYTGLQQPNLVFTQEERTLTLLENDSNQNNNQNIKYIHSAVSENVGEEIAQQIEATLCETELYLNDNLTLPDLCQELGVKSHLVSQVINQHMKTNFYKLINGYRVQYAVKLLDDANKNWTIERIALESGFSNRVTFNKSFKEQMKCTASEYKKQKVAS